MYSQGRKEARMKEGTMAGVEGSIRIINPLRIYFFFAEGGLALFCEEN
jgi:hypothetical protein